MPFKLGAWRLNLGWPNSYMPCAGSILTPCGGSYALDLWLNTNVATAVNEVASAVGKWQDTGLCLQEVQGRALRGAAVSTPGMTVKYCLNYCGGLGFLMAGVEYGMSESFHLLVTHHADRIA